MKNSNIIGIVLIFFILFLTYLFCDFLHNKGSETKTEYIQGETIKDGIDAAGIVPISEEIPVNPTLPQKQVEIEYRDTGSIKVVEVPKYIIETVDTAAIIAEYILKRTYEITLFDNMENGKLLVYPSLQYNRLAGLDYEFTPVYKQTTITKVQKWHPFLSVSYNTFNTVGLGGGIFYNHWGIEYQYIQDFNTSHSGHLIGLKYKF
ncbi:hypothetical protein LJB95_03205 [Paludibacteraceae bacterium OttesenSCG-928-F17]|nr:hypothetical protein [Paludibacteraceae bacterium OttesenSCG-928-F17]